MKSLATIIVKQTRVYRSLRGESEPEDVFLALSEKVEEYVTRLGYSSAHTLRVVVQLLTVGKIRLDFKDYSERLQLKLAQDVMQRPEAIMPSPPNHGVGWRRDTGDRTRCECV